MAKHELVAQPSARPTAKVTAAGLAALVATVVLSVADWSHSVDLPTWVDTLLTAAAAFAGGYLKKAPASEAE